MKNPNKLNLLEINGSMLPFLADDKQRPYKEINEFLVHLNELGNMPSTITSYARMLSFFLWYCLIVKVDFLDIKDLEGTFNDLLEGFAAWLRQDGKRSEERIVKIIQVILWFYCFHFLRTGNNKYLSFIDILLEKWKFVGMALRKGSVEVSPNYRKIGDDELSFFAANRK